ncbi:MAG: NAD-dependent DNA ligase LigA [Deltaproteobacteria bacterium]|nr:NAD-dependent DNA ligase LigA [Deltaproteobacteria bacterium]
MGKREKSAITVAALEKAIRRHNRLYFEKQSPEISDYAFDRLVEQLRRLRPDSPLLSEIPSESAPGTSRFAEVRHTSPMLSLDKCYREEDLNDWMDKFEGEVVASPKVDGCAVELRYDREGKLILAATRGDGVAGEEITENARMIQDIPQKISPLPLAGEGLGVREIRGEIYMRLSVFKNFKDSFANPRNLAAGAIKQKDPKKTGEYQLSFFGYDLLGVPFKTEWEKMQTLRSLAVPVVEIKKVPREKRQEVYDDFLGHRGSFDFETDGVVFKADRIEEQKRLGNTAHHPRYAIAYKFQGDSGKTVLKDVEWSVARTGVITPVGIVEPVELSGATVTRVSLHNYGLMKQKGVRIGAKVLMIRRGGVIPNLESVIEAGRGSVVEAPKRCPSCGAPTEIRDDFLHCTNAKNCSQTKVGELKHFVQVTEIEGFGDKLIERLYENGFVQDPADFYLLTKEQLLEIERMGEVLATKLIGNIQAKRELPLDLFLRALGIRELAKHTSKILTKEFGGLTRLFKVTEEELSAIHTVGEVIAKEVVAGLKKKRPLIEKLLKHVRIPSPLRGEGQGEGDRGKPFHGKKFLFTGSLLSMERREAEKRVEEKGGWVASGVTQELDYLVVGDGGGAGSKLEKAKKLQAKGGKVKIISEKEWKEMVGL